MTYGPAAAAWARPMIRMGERAALVTAVASALPYGTTLNPRAIGPVWIYKAQGVLEHHDQRPGAKGRLNA